MEPSALVIGSDHAGYRLKEKVKQMLQQRGIAVTDVGAHNLDPSDYPVFAARVARMVSKGEFARGITVCGSGIGASITANRFRKVRAALCITPEMARLSRLHNDSNVLVLGERITPADQIDAILDQWLTTDFEGGRHNRRVDLIEEESAR